MRINVHQPQSAAYVYTRSTTSRRERRGRGPVTVPVGDSEGKIPNCLPCGLVPIRGEVVCPIRSLRLLELIV
jgi:hypothetical protein